jgi:hypothetical protein
MGIAVAQIISYGAVNAAELALTDALLALGVALLSTFAIWLAIWKFIAKARPAALIASLIAFSFWAYARVLDAASGMIADAGAASDIRFALGLLLAWGAALLLATIWIRRTKQSLSGLYAIVDAVALIGVVLPLAALMNQLETGRTIQQESERVPSVGTASMCHPSLDPATPSQAGLPSIFLIVLDAYGRDDELTEHFGIRNGLGARLEEVGFYVAKESRANYTSTLQALPSLLNFDYVQNFIDPRRKGRAQYQELLQRNRFLEKIRAKGYRFISYETGIKLTEFRHADEYVLAPSPLEVLGFSFKPNYFERGLLGLTPAGPFLRHSKSLSPYTLHRSRVLHALKDLPRHASGSSPVFALAHILSPHEPFVFGRDGQDVSPRALPYALK